MHLGNTDAGKKECIENSFLLKNRYNSFKNIFTDDINYFVILILHYSLPVKLTCKENLFHRLFWKCYGYEAPCCLPWSVMANNHRMSPL